ncbi:MAG: acyl-CoA thioesterase [Thaumarchaeota archaeon]|nr:acyl-CoA thioesterase [Nitrososphaerota archaeon]
MRSFQIHNVIYDFKIVLLLVMKSIVAIKVVVQFNDVDMLGHVNNARYLTYFEMARTEYLYSKSQTISIGDVGVIIARAEIDYKFPAKWHDELTISMRTSAVGKSSWTYEYTVVREKDNKLIATGKTVQVAYDYMKGVPIALPDDLKDRLNREVEQTSA